MKWNPGTWIVLAAAACAAAEPSAAERWWKHVAHLASDELEGRNTGTPGHRKAVDYVATEFERLGLKAAGTDGYLQPVRLQTLSIDESVSRLELVRNGKATPLALGDDGYFSLRADLASKLEAPLVFAGYGLVIPEHNYDDLKGLDVRDKIVVTLQGGPAEIPGELKAHYQSASERWKAFRSAGAVGTASLANPKFMDVPWERARLSRTMPQMILADTALFDVPGQKISVVLNPHKAEQFFEETGQSFAELLKLADSGKQLPRFEMKASLRARTAVRKAQVLSHNVAALYPGTDSVLRNEVIVISAHIDHLGVAAPVAGDAFYNGAMDNASGVASILETARTLVENKTKLKRSVLFLLVTAEEKGLQGSKYFAAHPSVDGRLVANINLDMFLPLHSLTSIIPFGADESTLGADVRAIAGEAGIGVQPDPEPQRNRFIRSDQYSFIRRGVPSLAFKFGYEKDSPEHKLQAAWTKERYHAPSDDLNQPVDREAAVQFNALIARLLERIANSAERPQWNANSFFKRFERAAPQSTRAR